MRSIEFWNQRYKKNLDSGLGSRNDLLEFKVNFINDFIKKNNLKSVLDFGHGDLFIASRLNVDKYKGIDIFDPPLNTGLDLEKSRFDEYNGESASAVLCLDVLYHILEDEQDYMRKSLDKMIEKAEKYLIIYAQDSLNTEFFDVEFRVHLYNSRWIQYLQTKENVELIYRQPQPENGYTSAQFFVYKKND